MKPLARTPRGLLLGLHVLAAATWMGGVAALLVLSAVGRAPPSGDALATVRTALQWVDRVLVIPACLGSLATGALLSWRTPWGFFRHAWVTVKWVATLAMILFGILFLGPWVDGTAARAAHLGLAALAEPAYARPAGRIEGFGALQIALLVGMLFLSTVKPAWRRR
jgi:hypothetical protein